MLRQLTISEAIWVGALCVFAIGTAHAANPVATDRKNEYKVAVKNADADYKAAKEACKSRSGNDRDVCLKQAKADHVKATSEAKARMESKSAMAAAGIRCVRSPADIGETVAAALGKSVAR